MLAPTRVDPSTTQEAQVRVMECSKCGAQLRAATDSELAAAVMEHQRADHPETSVRAAEAAEEVHRRAHDANED